jgi:hypothetical protein
MPTPGILRAVAWLVPTLLAFGAVAGLWLTRRKRLFLGLLLTAVALDVVRILWWPGANELVEAARAGNVSKVKRCLWQGCEPDLPEEHTLGPFAGVGGRSVGRTPLTAAATLQVMRVLLDYGASPNVKDGLGHPPLIIAMSMPGGQSAAAIELMLDRGADPNLGIDETLGPPLGSRPAETSYPPLLHAVEQGEPLVVRLLLDHGATVTRALSTGWTALHLAAQSERPEIAAMLLDRGASLHGANPVPGSWDVSVDPWTWVAINTQGWTALHVAAARGSARVAQLLLDRGADVNALDTAGMTPLAVARLLKRPELERLLESRGGVIKPRSGIPTSARPG